MVLKAKVTLKLTGTFQIIFFLIKFFEFFKIDESKYENCSARSLLKAYRLILLRYKKLSNRNFFKGNFKKI